MNTRVQNIIPDRETAIELINTAIETLDPKPLENIVEELLTQGHRDGIGYMEISGDKPDTITVFFVLCEYYGFLSEKELVDYSVCYSKSKRKRV